MISDSAALVMFAIRSSIKLGTQLRQAYVEGTQGRELVLPLPDFFSTPDITSAANFFAGPGSDYVARAPALAALLEKRRTDDGLTEAETHEVLAFHTEFFNLKRAETGGLGDGNQGTVSAAEFNALITIRQWRRGSEPNPTVLQRVAGSLVEIGIDYLTQVPGALNRHSRHGRVVAGFLEAMDDIQFSESGLGDLSGRLFVAALETMAEHPGLAAGDDKIQELVRITAGALSMDVDERLQSLSGRNLSEAQRIGDWAELVFRSVLSSAGARVLEQPGRFLGVHEPGKSALVSDVGRSVLGLILDAPSGKMDRVFSRQGLEALTRSALQVLGDHPEILVDANRRGLQVLLSETATGLAGFEGLLTSDLLPELTRQVLERTGENLALFWPDRANDPAKNLLLSAMKASLAILTRKPSTRARWKARFGTREVLTVADTVLGELAENPAWLVDEAGELNEHLEIALTSTLEVLRRRADDRLTPSTAATILRTVVLQVGLRPEFFDKMPAGVGPAGSRLLEAALDALFQLAFDPSLDPRAAWQWVRSQTLVALIRMGLDGLSQTRLTPETIQTFDMWLRQQAEALAAGEPLGLTALEASLHEALNK